MRVLRGKLRGSAVRGSILVAACEALGIQPEVAGLRLLGFILSGEPATQEGWPDVYFEIGMGWSPEPDDAADGQSGHARA